MGVIPKMHIYLLCIYSVCTPYVLCIHTYLVYILTLYVLLQVLLPEGLANEAEKLLSVLLCPYDMSVTIKLQFIQACINNIENNK